MGASCLFGFLPYMVGGCELGLRASGTELTIELDCSRPTQAPLLLLHMWLTQLHGLCFRARLQLPRGQTLQISADFCLHTRPKLYYIFPGRGLSALRQYLLRAFEWNLYLREASPASRDRAAACSAASSEEAQLRKRGAVATESPLRVHVPK